MNATPGGNDFSERPLERYLSRFCISYGVRISNFFISFSIPLKSFLFQVTRKSKLYIRTVCACMVSAVGVPNLTAVSMKLSTSLWKEVRSFGANGATGFIQLFHDVLIL